MSREVFLNHIEIEVPKNDVHLKFIDYIPRLTSDERLQKLFKRLAGKCQIESRYSVVTPSAAHDKLDQDGFYEAAHFASTAQRMKRFESEAFVLAEKPISRLLKRVSPEEISHLIVVSCTGFAAPGLDLEIQKKFSLRSDLERTIIGFMGCYAAINALKAARHIVRSEPSAKVMIVNLELCTLHLQESSEPEQLMAFLQFADGCSVSLVSAEAFGLRLEGFRSEVLTEGQELIQWHIGDSGFEMVLSPEVPQALGRGLPSILPRLLEATSREQVNLWAVHPGGRSILDVVQAGVGLSDDEMKYSREILKNYGNMSSATIMFVLRSIMADNAAQGLGVAFAFGPGLTVESMRFEKKLM